MLLFVASSFAFTSCEETTGDKEAEAIRSASKADGAYIDGRTNALQDKGGGGPAGPDRTDAEAAPVEK